MSGSHSIAKVGQKVMVELDVLEALQVGQSLRTLARDERTPPGTKDIFRSVGTALIHACSLPAPGVVS